MIAGTVTELPHIVLSPVFENTFLALTEAYSQGEDCQECGGGHAGYHWLAGRLVSLFTL